MDARFVEKPPHIDKRRMRQISDADLLAAIDPGVLSVSSIDQLVAHVHSQSRRIPLPSRRTVVAALSGPEREAVLDAAEAALETWAEADFTDASIGRSRFYGMHYLLWSKPWIDAFALTGDERWARAWGESFDRWYDARDDVHGDWPGLDAVWYTLGVAVRLRVCVDAWDILSTALPARTVRNLLATVLGGCRWLVEEHADFRNGNWQFVGVCALFSTASLLPEFSESRQWIAESRRRIEEHLDLDVYADGGHSEKAPGYHQLCLNHVREAAEHGLAYLDIDLTTHPSYWRMHDWLWQLGTPEGWVPPLHDSPAVDVAREAETWAGGVPAYQRPPRALHMRLPGSGYVVSRSGDQPGDLYALLNTGPAVPHELESHTHRALLDFVLWGHGVPLAWEAGGPRSYDDPGYYDWYRAPNAHNTVLFGTPPDEDHLGAEVLLAEHGDLVDVFRGRWSVGEEQHQRTFLFVRPAPDTSGYWYVADRVNTPAPWAWRVHGRSPWAALGPNTWAATESPGLLVHATAESALTAPRVGVECHADLEWETSEGPTTYPAPGGVVDGTLHALELRPTGSTLAAVLHPGLQPGAAGAPDLTSDGDVITIAGGVQTGRLGVQTDRVGESFWLRSVDGRPMAALTWLGGVVADGEGLVFSVEGAEVARAQWGLDDVRIEVRATGRCRVRIRATAPTTLRVSGVNLPWQSVDSLVVFDLPEAGEWSVVLEGSAG